MTHEDGDWGDDGGLGPMLDAYAAARLGADPERTGADREAIVARAHARMRVQAVGAGSATRPPAGVLGRFRIPVAVAAASLLLLALVVGGVLAASGPGQPFYGVRLFVEELTLPAAGSQRADAEAARLDERLAEARAAAETGNGAAVTAALEAYRATTDAALAAAGGDPARIARLEARLRLHIAVLQALAESVPNQGSQAIGAAVERTESQILEILAPPSDQPAGPAATPADHGRPDATHAAPGTPAPKPAVTPRPSRSPSPAKSPPDKPRPSARPTPPAKPNP